MDIKLDNPAFKARAYEDEYIEYVIYALDDSGEEDGVISGPHTSPELVEGILPNLIEEFPGEYFHVVAILRNGKDRLMDSEVVWSNYPDNEAKKEGADEKLSYEKGHKNSKGEDAPWVIRSHKDNSVLASFPTKKEAENHMRTMKHYSKTEGKFAEIKAAINAAWSAAEAKWFRLDFQESTERLDVYPIASDNEGVGVNWGVLPERNTIVQYATDYRTGNSEVEREMPYKDLDELEKIFVDEFKSMDETLEVGADNGADIHPLTESRPTESEGASANEARSVSYFVLGKDTAELDAEEFVSTLEDAVLKDQSVETTAEPDGAIDVDIYGQLSPNEVERILQAASQLGIHISGLAVNI